MNSETLSAPMPRTLVIASRESRLAMWQAEHVQAALHKLYPSCDVKIVGMTTRGDQILDRTLSKVGGKGLFVKELEQALAEGRADLAVHSLKDVPMELPEGFTLAAIMEREDPRDAFVSNDYDSLAALPAGSVVGTSSLRREAMIRARYPHLDVKPLRGNLDTRLAKLDRGDYAAIILAAAGLKRLGLGARRGAARAALFGQREHLLLQFRRALRDGKALLLVAQVDIGLRHFGRERYLGVRKIGVHGLRLFACRFHGAARAAEQVDLPRGVEARRVERDGPAP